MVVCFDTETTGFGKSSQIIQFSACDENGNKLADYFIKPTKFTFAGLMKDVHSSLRRYRYIPFVGLLDSIIVKKVLCKHHDYPLFKWSDVIKFDLHRAIVNNAYKLGTHSLRKNIIYSFDKKFLRKRNNYSKFMWAWGKASEVNGITEDTVKHCKTIKGVKKDIQNIFNNADEIWSYNGKRFDVKRLNDAGIKLPKVNHRDIMLEFAPIYGEKFKNGNFKNKKLTVAADYYDYNFKAHDSFNDCCATAYVANCITHKVVGSKKTTEM